MKYPKDENGYYVIDGKKFKELMGTRAKVWHGTAYKTSGGLVKDDLIKNKHGEIVSKVKHEQESLLSNLLKHGYGHKTDGTFGYEKVKPVTERKSKSKHSSGTRKTKPIQQGGYYHNPNGVAYNAALFGGKRRHSRGRTRKINGGNIPQPYSPGMLMGGKSRSIGRNKSQSYHSSVAGGYAGHSNLFL